MTTKNSVNALLHFRTLFTLGEVGALSDGQLLERFTTGRGEPRELAFAALVERHGPFVLRICRSILRDESAAEDAFQATFLALARKAGSLWARDSLAPWLHQAAYRAAVHDRSAAIRRRSLEHAAAALRPESPIPPPDVAHDAEIAKIIHEEIDRLPGRFRVAVVLCDLEGYTHEQAAAQLRCALGTIKSRLARGRQKLRGRLVRRGVAPTVAIAASSAAGAARATVPNVLAEATVHYAATASAIPTAVKVITEGVLRSMFISKIKFVMTAAAIMTALAAGAIALAQSGANRAKDATEKPQDVGAATWTYHILASRDGEPPRKVAVVELTGDAPIRVDAPGALILIQPRRDGDSDLPTANQIRRNVGAASQKPDLTNPSAPQSSRPINDHQRREIVLTSPKLQDVTITQRYVSNIRAQRHIAIRAFGNGFLNEILVKEGQLVKKGDLLFKIAPVLKNAKPDAEPSVVTAPFDGIIDRLHEQQGSLVREGDDITTLSDNHVVWVYFNVPEKRYLDYMAKRADHEADTVEFLLANNAKFAHPGKIGAIEAQFNNDTGNIAFRADFPNPELLLRHGQSGTILIHHKVRNAMVIPQRATFEKLGNRYIFAVFDDGIAHQRRIDVQYEMDDKYIIGQGGNVQYRIVAEGVDQVHDGEKVSSRFRPIEEAIGKAKNPAD
jgi:membrane fusion protein (multidrug efflux system)